MLQNYFRGLIPFVLVALIGCGSSGTFTVSGPTGTVSGKVTLDGKPVPVGSTVTFRHTKTAHTPAAIVGDDGAYTLQLAETLRVPVGVYTVGVIAPSTGSKAPEDLMKASLEPKKDAGQPAIPAKFLNPDSSPLKLEVAEGQNTLDVKLTSQ